MRQTKPAIRIMLVDDHKLIIQACISLLKEIPHFVIAGQACHGKEAIELMDTAIPDVVILDADMPVMNGLDTLRLLQVKYPHIKVIILTMHKEMSYASSFIMNGAHAFLAKNCDVLELIKAIDAVMEEGYYFSSTISKAVIAASMKDPKFSEDYKPLRLTEREICILKLICKELSNAEIAKQLGVTTDTIKFFRKNLYHKTNERSGIGLIKYAIKTGIYSIER